MATKPCASVSWMRVLVLGLVIATVCLVSLLLDPSLAAGPLPQAPSSARSVGSGTLHLPPSAAHLTASEPVRVPLQTLQWTTIMSQDF